MFGVACVGFIWGWNNALTAIPDAMAGVEPDPAGLRRHRGRAAAQLPQHRRGRSDHCGPVHLPDPPIGVAAGIVLLHEDLTARLPSGTIAILAGIYLARGKQTRTFGATGRAKPTPCGR
ncbi:hypothetical protein [Mycolicibacterium sp. HS_4_1]